MSQTTRKLPLDPAIEDEVARRLDSERAAHESKVRDGVRRAISREKEERREALDLAGRRLSAYDVAAACCTDSVRIAGEIEQTLARLTALVEEHAATDHRWRSVVYPLIRAPELRHVRDVVEVCSTTGTVARELSTALRQLSPLTPVATSRGNERTLLPRLWSALHVEDSQAAIAAGSKESTP